MTYLKGLKQIQNYFQISDNRIKKWWQEGAPIFRIGSRYDCVAENVIEWLENHKKANFQKSCQ